MLKYLNVLIISALPFIEIRGALPYSQILGLPYINSLIVSIIGNLIPIPIVYFVYKYLFEWAEKQKYLSKLFLFIHNKAHKASLKLKEKSNMGLYLALLLFVAIPLPGTGAYTGILAAYILEMDFKKSFLSISFGVIIASIIITILTFFIKLSF